MAHPLFNRRNFLVTTAAGAVLSACGSDDTDSSGGSTPSPGPTPSPTPTPSPSPSPTPTPSLGDPTNREGQLVSANGARIFVEQSGQGSTPMLLIHGYPLSGALFSRVRTELGARYRVTTIDLRGYGQSPALGLAHSIPIYAQDALAVMDSLNIATAVIGGMSMGGPVVLDMYQRAASRFSGMLLIDTTAAPAPPPEAGLFRGTAEQAQADGVPAIIPGQIKEMLDGETRLGEPALTSYLEAVMGQTSLEAAVGGANALAKRADYRPVLGTIRVPTLVLVGQNDTVYPPETSRMMAPMIAGSTLAIIPDAAHAAIFEEPGRSAEAILALNAG